MKMKNQITYLKASEFSKIKANFDKKAYIVNIDGAKIYNLKDYINEVWKAFKFPNTSYVNYYAYMDWIRDLSWINSSSYIFVINNFEELMKESSNEKKIIIDSLKNIILPWWESDVEKCVVEGKAKSFNVYLVD
jgi:hypothetical protein